MCLGYGLDWDSEESLQNNLSVSGQHAQKPMAGIKKSRLMQGMMCEGTDS
jgi:hypothetical protein